MLRASAKSMAFRSGAMDMLHGMLHRECLTVVMLHRVLPQSEQTRTGADPLYTVTPEFLRACLAFLDRRYAIVSLEDVLLSRRHIKPLPRWPALITFDDGWHDNLDWARPALADTAWTLFVATDAATEEGAWWQDVLLWALRSQACSFDELCRRARDEGAAPADVGRALPGELSLLLLYAGLSGEGRQKALAPFAAALEARGPQLPMLRAGELKVLRDTGTSIGAHGASHLPLTLVPSAEDDMRRARDWLTENLGPDCARTMSFPHGRWDAGIVGAGRKLGYELMFTSDAVLNPCPSGWLASDVIGRIPLSTGDLADARGRLAPAHMSSWLRRDRQPLQA